MGNFEVIKEGRVALSHGGGGAFDFGVVFYWWAVSLVVFPFDDLVVEVDFFERNLVPFVVGRFLDN